MRKRTTTLLAGLTAAIMLSSLITAISWPTESEPAAAANPAEFNASLIISDRLFYDGSLMAEAQVQNFLDVKVACAPTAGNPGCLESYRSDSYSKAADAYCKAYTGAAGELASTILFKVATACNINPQVLIVMLQKEQGLVTSTNPTAGKYRIAMGYGCPDTAACDTAYYGFYNQVYNAARQLQRYKALPGSFNFAVGRARAVGFHPNAACGSTVITPQNAATAALYNYTPYQPNAAAIANINGTGDACSSYGNRNFWRYFTDWFGSTTVSSPAISFVTALYTDVLGRTASPTEASGWGRLLMSGYSSYDIASGFVNSDEYRLGRINAAYSGILGRGAEPGAANGWLVAMQRGYLGTDDVEKTFYGSDEYKANSGGTNESFVIALYSVLLHRVPGPEEVQGWVNVITTQSRAVVVNGFWNAPETARERVTAMYLKYLGRTPDAAGIDPWATLSITKGDAAVRWGIVGSAEYWARASALYPAGV